MGTSTQQKGLVKYVDKPYDHAMFQSITHFLVGRTYHLDRLSVQLMNEEKIKVTMLLLLCSDRMTIDLPLSIILFCVCIYVLCRLFIVRKNEHFKQRGS